MKQSLCLNNSAAKLAALQIDFFMNCLFTVDCMWGEWQYGHKMMRKNNGCTKSCDGGLRYESRSKKQEQRNGGKPCLGENGRITSCNTQCCPGRRFGRV